MSCVPRGVMSKSLKSQLGGSVGVGCRKSDLIMIFMKCAAVFRLWGVASVALMLMLVPV